MRFIITFIRRFENFVFVLTALIDSQYYSWHSSFSGLAFWKNHLSSAGPARWKNHLSFASPWPGPGKGLGSSPGPVQTSNTQSKRKVLQTTQIVWLYILWLSPIGLPEKKYALMLQKELKCSKTMSEKKITIKWKYDGKFPQKKFCCQKTWGINLVNIAFYYESYLWYFIVDWNKNVIKFLIKLFFSFLFFNKLKWNLLCKNFIA